MSSAPIIAIAVACGSSSSDGAGGGGDDSTGNGNGGDATLESSTLNGGDSSKIVGDSATLPDGQVDKTASCDNGLPIEGNAPAFAKTIGICTNAATDGYGLVSAEYSKGFDQLDAAADAHFDAQAYEIKADAGSVQAGMLPKFGSVIKPREGDLLGVLSTGYAREYDTLGDAGDAGVSFILQPEIDGTNYPTGHAPPGFPQATPGCLQSDIVNDMIDVKLTLKAPPDAHGFQFDFDFYGSDFPNYVCTDFNDAFIAYVNSSEIHGDNIVFDSAHHPINVNTPDFNHCDPDAGDLGCNSDEPFADGSAPHAHCEAGAAELVGTGYGIRTEDECSMAHIETLGGSTGWLTTTAPITPGETFTIEFMIWDARDGQGDSSVLVDNFQWVSGTPSIGSTRAK